MARTSDNSQDINWNVLPAGSPRPEIIFSIKREHGEGFNNWLALEKLKAKREVLKSLDRVRDYMNLYPPIVTEETIRFCIADLNNQIKALKKQSTTNNTTDSNEYEEVIVSINNVDYPARRLPLDSELSKNLIKEMVNKSAARSTNNTQDDELDKSDELEKLGDHGADSEIKRLLDDVIEKLTS